MEPSENQPTRQTSAAIVLAVICVVLAQVGFVVFLFLCMILPAFPAGRVPVTVTSAILLAAGPLLLHRRALRLARRQHNLEVVAAVRRRLRPTIVPCGATVVACATYCLFILPTAMRNADATRAVAQAASFQSDAEVFVEACNEYADAHQGRFPTSFDDLRPAAEYNAFISRALAHDDFTYVGVGSRTVGGRIELVRSKRIFGKLGPLVGYSDGQVRLANDK